MNIHMLLYILENSFNFNETINFP